MDAALSSSSDGDDDNDLAAPRRRAKKVQSRLTPKTDSDMDKKQLRDRHQPGEAVEARFGGRSKWFPGKVRRVYEGPTGQLLYDVSFDDGDKEEGILAGRVRTVGQCPPSLRAGLAVDIKLARKGKGYHPGKIGRVNDDGSLYVKLDDGDSEWSLPSEQIIPIFPYTSAEVPLRGDNKHQNKGHRAAPREQPEGVDARGEHESDGSNNSSTTVSASAKKNRDFSAATGDNATESRATPENTTLESSESPPQEIDKCIVGNGEGADGVSWIAELATSVGVPSPTAKASPAAPNNAADSDGGGNGLDWITGLVSTLGGGEGGGDRGSPSPGDGHYPRGRIEVTTGSSSGLPSNTPTQAGAAPTTANGPLTPAATKTRPPRAVTPTHLEWKPIKDGSFNRTWGAPPPDIVATDGAIEGDGMGKDTRQHQQNPKSPPRLSRSTEAPFVSSSSSDVAAPTDVRATTAAMATLTAPLPSWPQGAGVTPDGNARGSSAKATASANEAAPGGRGSGTCGEGTPLPSGNGVTAITTPAAEEARSPGHGARACDGETHDSTVGDRNAPGQIMRESQGYQGATAF
ncbi:unnamed protein product, partial [Hapterophycus canaliculatus]